MTQVVADEKQPAISGLWYDDASLKRKNASFEDEMSAS